MYYLVNEGNFQNEKNLDADLIEKLNEELGVGEVNERELVDLDGEYNPYKISMLNAFRKIEDPFGIEIMG